MGKCSEFCDQSQPFSESAGWGCEFHKCFSVFSPKVIGTVKLEWAEIRYFLCPTLKTSVDWS